MFRAPARRLAAVSTLAAILFAAILANAQTPGRNTPALDARMRTEVVEGLSEELLRHYVEEDTARMIADVVRERLRAGAYDAMTSPFVFAEAVTADLRRLNGDLHLSLRFDPEGSAGSGGPVIVRGPGGQARAPWARA
jgi:hypothetical protein